MARKPRIEFPGALYHVIARGNRREKIFLSAEDYQYYLTLVAKYKKRHNFNLYAYALMDNHIHLLIETSSDPLSQIMQGLQQSYTQFFNRKYNKVGHVFQGRYKTFLCQQDPYLLALVRYIHLNPVRRGLGIKKPYPWTSAKYYLREPPDDLIDSLVVLRYFGKNKKFARDSYTKFIADGLSLGHQKKYYEAHDQRILGDETFATTILEKNLRKELKATMTGPRISLEKIADAVCIHLGSAPTLLTTKVKTSEAINSRRLFIYLARLQYRYSLKEIATFLNMEISTITKNMKATLTEINKYHHQASAAAKQL